MLIQQRIVREELQFVSVPLNINAKKQRKSRWVEERWRRSESKYLGSNVTIHGDVEKEVNTRTGMAATAFRACDYIWRSSAYKKKTKRRPSDMETNCRKRGQRQERQTELN